MFNQFYGVLARASNIGRQEGNYTAEMFASDFPQFFKAGGECLLPCSILQEFLRMTNTSIQPDKWLESWRYAAGLYLAHNATLYLRGFREYSDSPANAAATGQVLGTVKSATLGDASVSYDDGAATLGIQEWGDLTSTQYGQLLATRARFIGMGGSYVL